MAQHLRFVLDGDDRLSPALNHAGDASARLHRRLNDDMAGNSRAVQGFTRDANGRLYDLNGRFLSAAGGARALSGGMPDLTRRLGDVASAGSGAASSLGSSGGGLGGALMGVAAVAGLSVLPAIGALVPMMVGAGAAAGTLALGFNGVGDALEAQAKGQKEYAAALKKLPKPAQDFTKALVGVKKEFSGFGKDIQAAMLPGFTQAVKDAAPVVKILGKAMTEMGGAFGDAAEGVGRMLKDSGFQDSLQANLKLGASFVRDMTSAMGPFIRSLLDFGAASGPTLKAFSDGIGGLLSKGLPGFFDGLKTGIGGAGKFLDGLFSMVNQLLPALGRLSGEVANVFGPIFGEVFKAVGTNGAAAMDMLRGALILARPVIRDIGYGLKAMNDFAGIVAPTLKDVGAAILGAFIPIGSKIDQTAGPLQRLDKWINANKGSILEASRVFGEAVIGMTGVAIAYLPTIIEGFSMMSAAVLESIDILVSGAAEAFGHLPIVGEMFKAADKNFDKFKTKYLEGMDAAQRKTQEFADTALPKLEQGRLKLNINNWEEQIKTAKGKLATVPPEKRAELKAKIQDLQEKVAAAKRKLGEVKGKSVNVGANTSPFFLSVGGVVGRSLGRAYIDVAYRQADANLQPKFRARGGPAPKFAGGGMPGGVLRGPGTGTSDSIPMWWGSNGEYVVNARSTAKHRGLLEAINSDQLGGAGMGGAGLDVGKGMVKGLDASTGGVEAASRRMAAAVVTGVKGELQIASPSKRTKALMADVGKGMILGLTGTQAKIKATAKDLAKDIWTAFSGNKDNRLVAYVNAQTKKLLAAAAKRDRIAATIATAKKYASELTSSAREGAGLSNLGLQAEDVSAGSIKAGLAGKLAQIKQFTTYIGILAKKGLNKSLLRQILNMGPEAGYAYASALVGADKMTFRSINSLQSQLDATTGTLGRVGADKLYDSGKNATKGFLAGLTSQQKELEATMTKIARAMQKALRKALGIKSPARAMIPDGINTTRGVAVGVLAGLPHVDRAMQAVAGRMAGRAVAAPAAGRAAVVGAGGTTTVNLTVEAGLGTDPISLAREMRRMLLELKRDYGINVNLGVA